MLGRLAGMNHHTTSPRVLCTTQTMSRRFRELGRVLPSLIAVKKSLTPSLGHCPDPTQHYADDVLTHDDDRSSSHVTESTVEANLDAEFYKQEGDRLIEIINVQCDAVAKGELEAKAHQSSEGRH